MDCILWEKATFKNGYGAAWNGQQATTAQRFVYEREVGSIPEGMVVHHECGERRCVNVEHLRLMPLADHTRMHHSQVIDGKCKHGHDLTDPANVWVGKNRWNCRVCVRERMRELRRRKREA